MKKTKSVIALALAGSLLFVGCAAADYTESAEVIAPEEAALALKETYTAKENIDPDQVDKAEMVYVTADADGTVTETEVRVTLKNPGGLEDIRDITNLREIKNIDGNEEFALDGDVLMWENHGEDISYKGLSDEELPVDVHLTYYLDGKEIAPADLAGKSGHVKLRFDYENHTDYVPFACVSLVMLDKEKCSAVKGEDVKILRYSDALIAFGVTIPGLDGQLKLSELESLREEDDEEIHFEDYFEIEMDAEDFALEYTETIVMNGIFEDLEDEDLDDLQERADNLTDAPEASDKLDEGIDKLTDGIKTYKDGIKAYTQGVDQCADAAQQIKDGMKGLNDAAAMLPGDLGASITGLYQAVSGLSDGLNALSANSQSLRDGADSIIDGCDALSEGVEKLNEKALKKMGDLGGDLSTLIGRIRTLRDGDRDYDNFSGISEGQTSSVLFLIETGEIKAE